MRSRWMVPLTSIILLLFLLAPSSVEALTPSTPGWNSVSVSGGSEAQRQGIRRALSDCTITHRYVSDRMGHVSIELVNDIEGVNFRVPATAAPRKILLKVAFDNLRPENHVRYGWGEDSPILRDIVRHEWAHQVFAAMTPEKQTAWNKSHFQLPGWGAATEAFAENFRLAMYPKDTLWRDYTVSPYPMMTRTELEWFIAAGPQECLIPGELPETLLWTHSESDPCR